MAAPTILDENAGTSVSSFDTASFTRTAGNLYIVVIAHGLGTLPNTPTASGWTAQVAQARTDNRGKLTILTQYATATSTGAVTFDFGGQTQSTYIYQVAQFTLARGVIQAVDNAGTGTTASENLAALSAPRNLAFGAVASAVVATDIVPAAAFTQLHDEADGTMRLCTFYAQPGDIALSATVGNGLWMFGGLEIADVLTVARRREAITHRTIEEYP